MVQRRFVSMCTGIFFLLVFIFALCPAQPVHADTIDLLNWHDVAVYEGDLSAGFAVVPGFEDQLNSARLYDSEDNLIAEFDLQDDRYDDRTECSGGTYWWKEFDSREFEVEDGTYTLKLDFKVEEAKSTYTSDIKTSSLEPEVTNLDAQVHDDGSIV